MDSIKIIISILSSSMAFVFELIFFYLIRIFFNIEIIGYYSVIISLLMTLSFIIDLGFSTTHLKYFPEAQNNHEEAIYNGTFLFFRFFQFMVFILIMVIFLPFLQSIRNELVLSYVLSLAIIISLFGKAVFNPLYLSKKYVIRKAIPLVLSGLMKILMLFLFILIFKSKFLTLIFSILISNLIYLYLNFFLIKNFKFRVSPGKVRRKYLKYAYPFFIINSLNLIVLNIDTLLLSIWFPIEQIANYFTAKQMYSFLIIFVMSISELLLTTFSKNISLEKEDLNLKLMNIVDKYLNLLIVPILMLIVLYSQDVLIIIFGANYELTGIIFIILSINLFILSTSISYLVQLQAMGKIKFIAKITILRHIIGVLLMILLIAPFIFDLGVMGAALSFTLTELFTYIVFRVVGYKKYNFKFYWGSMRNLIIMFLIIGFHILSNKFIFYSSHLIPLFMLLDIFLYFLINYLFKGFSKDDIKFLLSIFNYNNIKRTIFSELKDK